MGRGRGQVMVSSDGHDVSGCREDDDDVDEEARGVEENDDADHDECHDDDDRVNSGGHND